MRLSPPARRAPAAANGTVKDATLRPTAARAAATPPRLLQGLAGGTVRGPESAVGLEPGPPHSRVPVLSTQFAKVTQNSPKNAFREDSFTAETA